MLSGTVGPLEKRWTVTSPEPLVEAANWISAPVSPNAVVPSPLTGWGTEAT